VRVEGDSYEIGRKWGIWALALVFGGSLAIGTAIGAHGPVEFLKASDELRVTGLDAVW
jgi:acetyl-CoA acetyltransferase